jgi:hypothetical protein
VPHSARLLVAGAATLLLLGAAPAQADETATTSPSGSVEPSPTTHPGAPGNNGTVKVGDETDLDEEVPENDPHLPCTFNVQWFNYDSGWGELTSQVDLALHAPTDEAAGVTMTVEGDQAPTFTGNGGQPGAGDGRDHLEWYTLSFTGDPHPEQGYHVKVTVDTPHSKGSTTKSKVFWVGPCAEDEETPTSPAAPSADVPSSDATETPTTTESSPTTDASDVPATILPSESAATRASGTPTVLGSEAVAPAAGGGSPSDQPTVLGVEAHAQAQPGVTAPTAVAAGLPGMLQAVHAKATSPAGAVLVTAGLLLVGTAVGVAARRRRGSHQY